jgi:hypothetical protein
MTDDVVETRKLGVLTRGAARCRVAACTEWAEVEIVWKHDGAHFAYACTRHGLP